MPLGRHIVRASADQRPDVVSIVLGGDSSVPLLSIAKRGTERFGPRLALSVPDACPSAIRQLWVLARSGLEFRVTYQSESVSRSEQRRVDLDEEKANAVREALILELAPLLSEETCVLVIPALLIGHRKASSRALATACAIPDRTLRARVARVGLPRPLRLLGLVAGCSVAYQTTYRTASFVEIARYLGFDSGDELRHYLVRRTGLTPTAWRRLGFERSVMYLVKAMSAVEPTSVLLGD